MRIIGVFPREDQVGWVVDSLRNMGLDREDMIITTLAPTESDSVINLKSQTEDLTSGARYTDFLSGDLGESGIVVSVEVPSHQASRVRAAMEETGALEIRQD